VKFKILGADIAPEPLQRGGGQARAPGTHAPRPMCACMRAVQICAPSRCSGAAARRACATCTPAHMHAQ
jgi:hypothetical protein